MTDLFMLQIEAVPEIGTFGIVAGVVFFLVFAALAYIVFRMMRKTVKWAIRLTVVAVILVIAFVGSMAIYWKSSSTNRSTRPRPAPTRNR